MITAEEKQRHHDECEKNKKIMLDSGQPMGRWDLEPNRIDSEYKGYPCLALRNTHMLNWCGYVGVPKGHPFYGKHYDEVEVDVHGGLTFAGPCNANICHTPKSGKTDDVWWLGFDCAHAWDLTPFDAMRTIPGLAYLSRSERFTGERMKEHYRDLRYVKEQCHKLTEQIIEEGKLWTRIKTYLARLSLKMALLFLSRVIYLRQKWKRIVARGKSAQS